jgi:hypothetical protein
MIPRDSFRRDCRVALEPRGALDFRVRQSGLLALSGGALWLTRAGDLQDYCLRDGDRMVLVPGHYAVFALGAGWLDWQVARRPLVYEEGGIPCLG